METKDLIELVDDCSIRLLDRGSTRCMYPGFLLRGLPCRSWGRSILSGQLGYGAGETVVLVGGVTVTERDRTDTGVVLDHGRFPDRPRAEQ